MTYGNVNVDTVTTSTPNGILGAGNASIMKNRIINGAMVIDQRNAGASVTASDGAFDVDRWLMYLSNSTGSKGNMQQNQGSVTPPVGFTNYLGFTTTSAYSVGTNDGYAFQQRIEGYNMADLGWGTANAKTVTLSFWAYSSLTGTFGGAIANGGANYAYPFSYSIPVANTWTQISVTIAGATSGTWLTTNGIGAFVSFSVGTGTTYSGTAGAWTGSFKISATGATSVVGTNGATFYITGVQLEVGSSATGFEYRQYTTELQLCQRYLPYFVGQNQWAGQAFAVSNSVIPINFPVTARVPPTGLVYSGPFSCLTATGSGASATLSLGGTGAQSSYVFFATSSAFIAGNATVGYGSNATTSIVYFTGCEL